MAITQQWYNYAFDECRAADAAAASGAAGGSLGLARRRTVFIELATACLHTQELFFRTGAHSLEGLRSLLWAPATVSRPSTACWTCARRVPRAAALLERHRYGQDRRALARR